jgi:uncharacterized membrane-anchored protein YhcB (DUF1043 family)
MCELIASVIITHGHFAFALVGLVLGIVLGAVVAIDVNRTNARLDAQEDQQ